MTALELDETTSLHRAQSFAHRADSAVHLVQCSDLSDEAAVTRFYGALSALWASISAYRSE